MSVFVTPQYMIRNREWIAWLLACLLVGSQAFLLLHNIGLHADSHAANCQICAHGSGLGDALPKPLVGVNLPIIITPAATFISQKKQ
jgi:hypothetical protein